MKDAKKLTFKTWFEAIADPDGQMHSAHDIDAILKQSHPDLNRQGVFVTFTSVNKFGINPKAIPADPPTPAGAIYAYPADYLFQHGVWRMPFPMNEFKKYLWFFEPQYEVVNIDDPKNTAKLEAYAQRMGSTLQAEVQKLGGVSADQDTQEKWYSNARDKYIKHGYAGREIPTSHRNYFQTYTGKKPDEMPLQYFSKQGPAGRYTPQSYQPEGPAYNQYVNYLQSSTSLANSKTNKPEDLFWWLPFMWAEGDIAKWSAVYKAMGVKGILDNGHHRIHPAQSVQAAIFDSVNNNVLQHFNLEIGTNSYTKGRSISHGEPERATAKQYKQRSVYKYANNFVKLIDELENNFAQNTGWGNTTPSEPDDYLTNLDQWGRKIEAIARKIKSVEGIGPIDFSPEMVNKIRSIDPSKADPQTRDAVQYVKDTLIQMSSKNAAAA